MIYAISALILGLLAWGIWMYSRGRKATKSETELSQVQELGAALDEAEEDLREETETALDRMRRRLRERWGLRV